MITGYNLSIGNNLVPCVLNQSFNTIGNHSHLSIFTPTKNGTGITSSIESNYAGYERYMRKLYSYR